MNINKTKKEIVEIMNFAVGGVFGATPKIHRDTVITMFQNLILKFAISNIPSPRKSKPRKGQVKKSK